MELWAPVSLDNPDSNFVNTRGARVFDLIGRLQSGATLDELHSQLASLTTRLAKEYPDAYPQVLGWQADAVPLAERVVGNVRPALLVLLGAVGFVLLIGCSNVANLLLARATTRDREIAIRTALGGSRMRLVRQLLTESLVLAALGGLLGLLLAVWGTTALGHLASQYLPRAREISIDPAVLGFTAFLILLTGIGFGLIPAIHASRPDLQGVLKDSGRGGQRGAPRTRVRGVLVVMEVAIALVLLAGAGLLLRSFQQLVSIEPGFNPQNLLTMQVWLPVQNDPSKGRYFTDEQRRAFFARAQESVQRTPGVRDAALVSRLAFRGRGDVRFEIEGHPTPSDGRNHEPPDDRAMRARAHITAIFCSSTSWPTPLRARASNARNCVSVKGSFSAIPLDFDDAAVAGEHKIGVGVGVGVFGVVEVEHRAAVAYAAGYRRDVIADRLAADNVARLHPGETVMQCDPGAGDRCRARAAVGLNDVAVDGDLALSERFEIDHRAQAAPDQALI